MTILRGPFAIVLTILVAVATPVSAANDTKAPPPVSSEPQQTSASFGDWIVRCNRPGDTGKRVCEAAQSLVVKGQQAPIAQIAFGHAPNDTGNALTLTVLLPVNVAFDKPPQFSISDGATTNLTYRRCLPGGCYADTKADAAFIRDVRAEQKSGRLVFTDAAERSLVMPISLRGLAQALDNLAKEARN